MGIYNDVLALLQRDFPAASCAVIEAESGATMIDIRLGKRFFVVEHVPGVGFGVSELPHDDPGFSGHDEEFADGEEAVRYLRELLA